MSLDITIKVDPGNATQGAAKVEAALGKVEDQAEKVGPAVAKSMREGSTAVDKLKASSDAAGGSLSGIAKNVAGINFKQGAAGVNQAFELLNQKLKITDSSLGSAIGSAVKFGATGAQIAGPWGAAIGAVAGVASDFVGSLFEAEAASEKLRKAQEEESKAYWDAIHAAEQKKRVAEELAPAMAELARVTREQAEASALTAQVNNSAADEYRKLTVLATAYSDKLSKINGELAMRMHLERPGSGPQGGGQSVDVADEVKAARDLRDANLAVYAATLSNSKLYLEMEGAENKRKDRLEDLANFMGNVNTSEAARNKALKEYNTLIGSSATGTEKAAASNAKAAAAAKAHADELKRLTAMMLGTGQTSPTLLGRTGADADKMSYTEREFARSQELAAYDLSVQDKVDALSAPTEPNLEADLAAHHGGRNPALDAANDRLTTDIQRQQAALDALQGAATMAGDALVDAFMGADVSAKELIKTITTMLAKQALGALIGAGFGALSPTTPKLGGGRTGFDAMTPAGSAPFLPGFATGGDMLVGGSGGPDTKIAAFRVSPGESIHVRTPQQRDTAQRPTGGGSRTVNINVPGTRDAVTEHNIEGLVVRVVERNNPALRSRLRG